MIPELWGLELSDTEAGSQTHINSSTLGITSVDFLLRTLSCLGSWFNNIQPVSMSGTVPPYFPSSLPTVLAQPSLMSFFYLKSEKIFQYKSLEVIFIQHQEKHVPLLRYQWILNTKCKFSMKFTSVWIIRLWKF